MANISGVDAPVLNDQDYVEKIIDSFDAVDAHDHTSTKGLQIPTGGLADGAITNAKVSASAAIALSKLAALTASRAVQSGSGGLLEASTVTSTELGYLSGVTSAIQTQINSGSSGLSAHEAATAVHGATGAVVGTTNTQTLTNKTLTAPVINSPTGIVKGDVGLGNVDNTSDATKNSAVATLTNKTLTTPVIDVIGATDQGSTPATPSSGTTKIYSKTDGKVYKLTSAGVEQELGAGAPGGTINDILNPDFETSTTGWAAYADAAGTVPVDGTGGSPVTTITRSTSSPLRGTASGLITKDAANRQGEGVSYAFTIAAADQAKMHSISFDYSIASGTFAGGTDSTTGDLNVYIYDVTNATIIQPAGFKVLGSVSGQQYKHQATFQTNSNSTSYRLILGVVSTSTSAWTVKIDNVQVGPQPILFGAPVTDPVAYTPTFQGFGTPTSVNFVSWRSGKYLFVEGSFVAGTTTASEARIGLGYNGTAGNVVVDSAALPSIRTVGKAAVSNLAARDYQVLAEPSVTYLTVGYQESTTTAAITKQNGNAVNSSGNTFTFFARVPIAGWGSSVLMSNDTDTRVVAMGAQLAATSLSNNSETTLTSWTTQFDTHGAFASGIFTAPVSGVYEVSGSALFTANSTGSRYIVIQKNGSGQINIAQNSVATSATVDTFVTLPATTIQLNAGDTLRMRAFQNSGGSLSMGTGVNTTISIKRLSGPAAIATTDTVAARYNSTSSSISSTPAKVTFSTKDNDSHSAYSSGTYTIPVAGRYGIKAQINVTTTPTVDHTASLYIYRNGSPIKQFLHRFKVASNTNTDIQITDDFAFNAGDTLEIYASSEGTSPTIPSSSSRNVFSVVRVGN